MAAPKRSQKAFKQFLIAGVVSVVLGIGGIMATLSLVSNVSMTAEQEKQLAYQEAQKAKAEVEKLKKESQEMGYAAQEVQALVEIPEGTIIQDAMIAEVPVERNSMPAGVFTTLADVSGRMTKVALHPNEPITKLKLLDNGGGLPVLKGMRAITIQVDSIGGINGAVSAGSFVDIISTLENEDKAKIAKTLLQRILVLSVGGTEVSGGAAPPAPAAAVKTTDGAASAMPIPFMSRPQRKLIQSVTLSVTPKQAEILALASTQGRFHLTLRNQDDIDSPDVAGTDVKQLVSIRQQSIPPKPLILPQRPKRARISPEIPVQLSTSSFTQESLPLPSRPQPRAFTMTIYKGGSVEDKQFQVEAESYP